MRHLLRPAVPGLATLALLSSACSNGTDPGPDLTAGTFQVTVPQFAVTTPGPCDVAPFVLTVNKTAGGQAQLIVPVASFTCVNASGTFDLSFTSFSTVGDSLQMVLAYTGSSPNPQLTMRWKPGKTNLTGSAVFDLGGAGTATVTWTGVRQ